VSWVIALRVVTYESPTVDKPHNRDFIAIDYVFRDEKSSMDVLPIPIVCDRIRHLKLDETHSINPVFLTEPRTAIEKLLISRFFFHASGEIPSASEAGYRFLLTMALTSAARSWTLFTSVAGHFHIRGSS
jgi:hypothetical protein